MSNNSYQKCKVCQNNIQSNLTWTDIGRMHPGFVHTLSKNYVPQILRQALDIGIQSLSIACPTIFSSPNTTFLLVDKVWSKIGHWTNSGHTLNMDKQLTRIVFCSQFQHLTSVQLLFDQMESGLRSYPCLANSSLVAHMTNLCPHFAHQ